MAKAASARPALIEFPADDPERARRFWGGILGEPLAPRDADQGQGWQTRSIDPAVGVHERGRGPGDSFSLPYFEVEDVAATLGRVESLGGTVIHPGERWAICKDTEGSPFALAGPDGRDGDRTAANTALVERFYAEAINDRDLGAVDRLLSPGFTHNGVERGRSGQREAVKAFLDAFPDLLNEIELILAEGDLVAAHQSWSGTHRGPFLGVEATGRTVAFTSTAVLRVRDGLIAEAWDEIDVAGLLAQLGPPPG